jgi:hypothetical protein
VHRIGVILLALLLATTTVPAGAEHKVFYRYVVLGFVKDAQGRLMRGREVDVVRDKTGLNYPGVTDQAGFYVIVVRLGDESDGETLTVRVGKTTTRIKVHFDPGNHVDDRGTRVDLDGSKFIERTAAFRPTLSRYMGAVTH